MGRRSYEVWHPPVENLKDRWVAFTGTLSQLSQAGAARVVKELGGVPQASYTTGSTTVLVVGAMKPGVTSTQAWDAAKHIPGVSILSEDEFMALIPPEVLARHHRSQGEPPPPDISRFRDQVSSAAEAYLRRCVRGFLADELPGQKAIEYTDHRDPDFTRLGRLVAEVVFSVPRNSPVTKEIREALAEHNLHLVIGNPTAIRPGKEYAALKFQIKDKRRFILDAHWFIKNKQV